MNYRSQVACAWCGPLMTLGFFIGLLPIAHFIWPPAPGWSALHIAHWFQTDTLGKRAGLFIAMVPTGLLAPFYAVISNQMRRIEGVSKPLTYSQLVAGACTVLEIILPLMLWQGVAYRPFRDPVVTQALNDVAWLTFLGTTTTVLAQNAIIGAVVLQDKAAHPVFPRWYADLNFFAVAGVMPAGFVEFFKSGPLAWDGAIVWGVGVAIFFIWICISAWLVILAARQERDTAPALAPAAAIQKKSPYSRKQFAVEPGKEAHITFRSARAHARGELVRNPRPLVAPGAQRGTRGVALPADLLDADVLRRVAGVQSDELRGARHRPAVEGRLCDSRTARRRTSSRG
jgi:hypothetical protein